MTALGTVSIRAVRGIRSEIALKLEKKSLVLRGDNGTGKSSIVHGLRWALRGEEPPPKGADAEEHETLRRHILEKDPSAPRVVIELAPKGRIEVTAAGAVSMDAEGEAFRRACLRASPFLRRPDLLGFLSSRPSDRFRYLEAFLDLDDADTLRDGLAKRAKEQADECESKRAKLDADLAKAASLLPLSERRPKSWEQARRSFCTWAAALGVGATDSSTWEDLKRLAADQDAAFGGEAVAKRRAELTAALERVNQLTLPASADAILAETRRLEAGLSYAGLAALLREAEGYLEAVVDAEACPVCEQPVRRAELLTKLEARRTQLSAVATVALRLDEIGSAWADAVNRLRDIRAECQRVLGDDAPALDLSSVGTGRAAIDKIISRHGSQYREVLQGEVDRLRKQLSAALAELPSEAATEDRRAFARAVRYALDHQLAIEVAEPECEDLARKAKMTKLATDALKKARQEIAQELLNEIGAFVAKFYTAIHPPDASDEVTGPPTIEVQGHGGGTAFVRGEFDKVKVNDPQWVYSDGHLDTVGICVFLALRRFRADRDKLKDPRLMVLDDVVLSIDLGHARRLLAVIDESFDDHQVLILTHNGLFTDWCARHLSSGRYLRRVIARWSLEAGPVLGDHLTALEHLRRALQTETSPKLLAQAMMNLLDEWIADARFEYSLQVQSKRGDDYTLSDLWDPFRSKFGKLAKTVGIGKVGEILERIPDVVQLRNRLGAHENDFAKEFPLQTVREISSDVLLLVEQLLCAKCSGFAQPMPSISAPDMFKCKCDTLWYIRPSKASPPKDK